MARKRRAKVRPASRVERRGRGLYPWLLGGAAALLVVGVVVAGLATRPGGSSPSAGEGPAAGAVAMEAPDFTAKTTSWSGGRSFTLSRGLAKPTVLYFMAAWCFTCIPETQALARLHKEMGDKLNILILDVDTRESEAALRRFKEQAQGGDHMWAMDAENRIALAYNVRALDTTIIIDQEGRQAYRDAVPTPYDKLKSVLTGLLEGRPVAREAQASLPGRFYPDQGRQHLPPGRSYDGYNSNPPTSGPHAPQPAPWGIHDRPIPKEVLIHNLEHGGVLILYRSTDIPEAVDQLKLFAERYLNAGRKVILAPYPDMRAGFALVAWTYLDAFSALDPNRIAQFMESDVWHRAPEALVE